MPRRGSIRKRLGPKQPSEADAEVGRRIRVMRMQAGLSQSELAGHLGITFQQIQKYEKGVNRVGAGRLQVIAKALNVPMTFFFDAAPGEAGSGNDPASLFGYLQSKPALALMKAFHVLRSRKLRRAVVVLVQGLAAARH